MSKYTPTIGLEIHAELRTRTKMFCHSRNDTEEKRPNVNVCPICMGHPGTLPVINKEAVRQVLRIGVSVDGDLADYTEFDRKNYFYPDIPKGYQISQYKFPLVKGGELTGVKLTRIHLEEDTAKSAHDKGEESLVDFNRAGVPLMELVTEPVIHDAGTAAKFAKELQLLLRYLEASDANMEKGEMRVEANVSVSAESGKFGAKVEVKNLNSFKSVEKAINYEIERQTALLEKGEKVIQETRGWDENRGETFSQRAKEESHDYRYFPDPDLPKLFINEVPEFDKKSLRESLPELPWEKRQRLGNEYGLRDETVEIFVRDSKWGRYFEEVATELQNRELVNIASNYIVSDLKEPIPVKELTEVVRMLADSRLSSRGAKDILRIISEEGGIASEIASSRNLIQKNNDEEVRKLADKIIHENEKAVNEYRSGKQSSLQFMIGRAMKESKGSANPQMLKKMFEEILR
ncbi:Asp-tRNA(Asn)/Glu-tRNA(Gln) amidotransferase subunit GatB [Candidatus Parcubacteria bacterium]|nr:Asp-tRNA(Asn)/Glu-tRNA(Gln) amidotransferase subunit GatB [Candidatus Parcubacteria bacterium]